MTTMSDNVFERGAANAMRHPDLAYRLLLYAGILALVVPFLLPLYWLLVLSVTPPDATYRMGIVPPAVGAENYLAVVYGIPFLRYVFNSFVVAVTTTTLVVIVAALAGYAFGRLRFPGRRPLLVATLAVAFFPPITFLLPLFRLFTGGVGVTLPGTAIRLTSPNLFNTVAGVVFPLSALTMPLAIYVLMTFFAQIPDRMEDLARVEGATRLGALARVIAPLSAPGVATAAILTFVQAYNEFLFSFLMNDGRAENWAPIVWGIVNLKEAQFTYGAAASVLGLLPVTVVVLLGNDRIVEGLSTGSQTRSGK